MVQHTVGDILQEYENKKLGEKSEYQQHKNIDNEICEEDLHESNTLVLGDIHKE